MEQSDSISNNMISSLNGYVECRTLTRSHTPSQSTYLSIIAVLLLDSACDLLLVARP